MKKYIFLPVLVLLLVGSCGGKSRESSPAETNTTVVKENPDWRRWLADYEQFVDEYVALVKALESGNLSKALEIPSLLAKVRQLTAQAGEVRRNLSPEDRAEFDRVNDRILEKLRNIEY